MLTLSGGILYFVNFFLFKAAAFCNRYPNIDVTYAIKNENNLRAGSNITIDVQLERYFYITQSFAHTLHRELDEGEEVGSVYATFYPKEKAEGWWLVLGDTKTNRLLAIKSIYFFLSPP